MSKEEKNKIVPKLRFPEFRNAEEWEIKNVGEIATVIASGDLDTNLFSSVKSDTHIHPVYSNALVNEGLYGYYSTHKYSENSITITARGNLGTAFLRKDKFMGIGRLIVVSDFKNIKPNFLKECWNYIVKIPQEVTSIPQLTAIAVRAITLPIPEEKKEQQKIADCLSSLDELITAQTQKLEALKAHKKGLMQQLFPAEVETVPKLRFAEFRDSGEWEENILDNVAVFLKGKGISKADISTNGILPCIRYGELYTQYSEIIISTISFTNLPSEELILSEANDVIIPSSGETREDIATASCVMEGGIALGGDLNIIRSKINGVFLSYYLTHAKKNTIAMLAQGDAVVHLYSNQLKKLKINFPKIENEQQKIADCLSSLDELITGQAEKIEALKVHKKGLMQQLFPDNI